jgi:hypothetical protein
LLIGALLSIVAFLPQLAQKENRGEANGWPLPLEGK